MRHHFSPEWLTYAPMFSDDAPVHTKIKNIEEFVKKNCTEELVRAGFFLCWCFYLLWQGEFFPIHHEAHTPDTYPEA